MDRWSYTGKLLAMLQKGFELLGTVTEFQYPHFNAPTHAGRVISMGDPYLAIAFSISQSKVKANQSKISSKCKQSKIHNIL